ncbi:MAG: GAF domain-containing sensor histidine kinase [Cyanobacteria bacterium SBC]|nr:GAF domain-containing sensor histidine kinase [Cyanobacteria bacterium SBC]
MVQSVKEQLIFLNHLSELLVQRDSEAFINLIPQKLCDFLKADACIIWKHNFKEENFTVSSSSPEVDTNYQALELDFHHPEIQSFLQNSLISCILDLDKYISSSRSRLFAQEEIQKRGWVALVSCIIKTNNESNEDDDILGIVDVFYKHQHGLDELEKSLIRHVSNLIVVAWQKTEQNSLETLTKIIQEIIPKTEESQIWESLYDGAAKLVDAEHWLVGKLDDSNGKIKILRNSPEFQYPKEVNWKQGIIGLALQQERTINANNVRDEQWNKYYKQGWIDTRSEIAVPIQLDAIPVRQGTQIVLGTKLIGILNIESTKVNRFSQKDREHLELLARFVAILINRREYEAKLKALRKIEEDLAKTQNYDKTINIILKGIKKITKFYWINISLINSERTHIESKHITGIKNRQTDEFLKLARHELDGNDIQADIVRNKQIEVPETQDPRFDKEIWNKHNHKNLVRVFLPLIEPSTDLVIGTLEVGYRREYRKYIYEEDIQILKGFVDYLVDILELQKSGFIQRIIHEIKSPIDGILSHTSFLQNRWNQLSSTNISVKFEDMMVDGYLLRYQAKQIEYFLGKESFLNPDNQLTDLFQDVLLKIINQLKPIICDEFGFKFKDIHYQSELMRSIKPIYTDKIMLNQVFFNLFMNALKYSKKAPIKKIELDVKSSNREITIVFKDWGMGIDSTHQYDIFRAGFRTPDATKTAMGSGLGLTISKDIMQKLGGKLILSHPSQPTEFHVILPKENPK